MGLKLLLFDNKNELFELFIPREIAEQWKWLEEN